MGFQNTHENTGLRKLKVSLLLQFLHFGFHNEVLKHTIDIWDDGMMCRFFKKVWNLLDEVGDIQTHS
jgi:hypothetical protein